MPGVSTSMAHKWVPKVVWSWTIFFIQLLHSFLFSNMQVIIFGRHCKGLPWQWGYRPRKAEDQGTCSGPVQHIGQLYVRTDADSGYVLTLLFQRDSSVNCCTCPPSFFFGACTHVICVIIFQPWFSILLVTLHPAH